MTSRAALTVDLQAANARASDSEIAHWAAGQSVFVSSLIGDMLAERKAARDAVTGLGARPVMFEDELGAQDVPADRAYLDGLAVSTIYLGIYGDRYGQPLANGYSATHDEFRHADNRNTRMALFVRNPFTGAEGPQRDFVGGIRARYTTGGYTDADNLGARVEDRLITMATDELTPWVILGDTAFRAESIVTRDTAITIRALIRSGRVAEIIQGYLNAGRDVAYAGPHDSAQARVDSVSSEATSAGSRTLEVVLRRLQDRGGSSHLFGMTVNGVGPEEVLERALRGALFGDPVDSVFSIGTIPDPLAVLWTTQLPDAVLRSLTYVLLSETLREVGIPGGASRFVLGPAKSEGRFLELSWYPVARYSNRPAPVERTISGYVHLA